MRSLQFRTTPINDTSPENLWVFGEFIVTNFFHTNPGIGHCQHCGKPINYNYIVRHPQFGDACVGMECVTNLLSEQAMVNANRGLRQAKSTIIQTRFRNRLNKVMRKVPPSVLHAWQLEVEGTSFRAGDALRYLQDKLQIHCFLNNDDIKLLQAMEQVA